MRKLVVDNLVSLDSCYEGRGRKVDALKLLATRTWQGSGMILACCQVSAPSSR